MIFVTNGYKLLTKNSLLFIFKDCKFIHTFFKTSCSYAIILKLERFSVNLLNIVLIAVSYGVKIAKNQRACVPFNVACIFYPIILKVIDTLAKY